MFQVQVRNKEIDLVLQGGNPHAPFRLRENAGEMQLLDVNGSPILYFRVNTRGTYLITVGTHNTIIDESL